MVDDPMMDLFCPLQSSKSPKIPNSAAERNKAYILEVLEKYLELDNPGSVLEISSGTGQHVVYFAEYLTNLTFQPSEYDQDLFSSINSYIEDAPTKNIKPPVYIDVATDCKTWDVEQKEYDYMININMMHITPIECTEGLFQNAPKILRRNGLLITYGPYAYNGIISPQSNIEFDRSLRRENSKFGLRDVKHLEKLGELHGLQLLRMFELPVYNKCLVWQNISKQ